MIRLLLPLLLALSVFTPLQAQQALFDEATFELENGDLDRARELFRTLEEQGHHAPELFWNQAMVALESDSLGLAKYYLLRASQFPDFRERALAGLERLDEQFSRRSSVLPPLPWDRLLSYLHHRWGSTILLWVSLLLMNLVAVAWTVHRARSNASLPVRISIVLTAFVSLLLFLSSMAIDWRQSRTSTGVQIGERSPVYQQPDSSSTIVATLHEGYLVYIPTSHTNESNPYYPVRLENGLNGWVQPDQLRTFQGIP